MPWYLIVILFLCQNCAFVFHNWNFISQLTVSYISFTVVAFYNCAFIYKAKYKKQKQCIVIVSSYLRISFLSTFYFLSYKYNVTLLYTSHNYKSIKEYKSKLLKEYNSLKHILNWAAMLWKQQFSLKAVPDY